jgi:hypothetical protein
MRRPRASPPSRSPRRGRRLHEQARPPKGKREHPLPLCKKESGAVAAVSRPSITGSRQNCACRRQGGGRFADRLARVLPEPGEHLWCPRVRTAGTWSPASYLSPPIGFRSRLRRRYGATMTREARWLGELDPEKRQWLLDHEGDPLPAGFGAAILAAGGPAEIAGREGGGWSWESAGSLHTEE